MGSTTTLLAKLQHKSGTVVVLNSPPEFEPVMQHWRAQGLPVSERRNPGSTFLLVFVRGRADIERQAGAVITSVGQDGVLWFAYPKQSSARYRTDIRRDVGWDVLGRMGYEGVRQIAIDDDWTALRFRSVDTIQRMQRDPSRAMTARGKQRTQSAAPGKASPAGQRP